MRKIFANGTDENTFLSELSKRAGDEELAMRARYDYLIRTAKERGLKCRLSISD